MKLHAAHIDAAIALTRLRWVACMQPPNQRRARVSRGPRRDVGVNAVQAAGKGFTSEEEIFETKLGSSKSSATSRTPRVTRDLGHAGAFSRHGDKIVPGGHPQHAIDEAAANASRTGR